MIAAIIAFIALVVAVMVYLRSLSDRLEAEDRLRHMEARYDVGDKRTPRGKGYRLDPCALRPRRR